MPASTDAPSAIDCERNVTGVCVIMVSSSSQATSATAMSNAAGIVFKNFIIYVKK